MVDSLHTAIIFAVDPEQRFVGPTKIAPFPAPYPCAQLRTEVNSLAKCQTFSPFSVFYVDDAPMRSVSRICRMLEASFCLFAPNETNRTPISLSGSGANQATKDKTKMLNLNTGAKWLIK